MMPDLVESTFPHTVPDNRPVEDNHPEDLDDVPQSTINPGSTDQFDDRLHNE